MHFLIVTSNNKKYSIHPKLQRFYFSLTRRRRRKVKSTYWSLPIGKTVRLPLWWDWTPMNAPLSKAPPHAGVTRTLSWTWLSTLFPNTIKFPSATDIPAPTVIFDDLMNQTQAQKEIAAHRAPQPLYCCLFQIKSKWVNAAGEGKGRVFIATGYRIMIITRKAVSAGCPIC